MTNFIWCFENAQWMKNVIINEKQKSKIAKKKLRLMNCKK